MKGSPCFKCTEREFKCHSLCEKYIEYRAERDQMLDDISKANKTRNAFIDMNNQKVKRLRKRKNR